MPVADVYKFAAVRNFIVLSMSHTIERVDRAMGEMEEFIHSYLVDHFSDNVMPMETGWLDSYFHTLESTDNEFSHEDVRFLKKEMLKEGLTNLPLSVATIRHLHDELERLEGILSIVLKTYQSGRTKEALVLTEALTYAGEMFEIYVADVVREGKELISCCSVKEVVTREGIVGRVERIQMAGFFIFANLFVFFLSKKYVRRFSWIFSRGKKSSSRSSLQIN